MKDFLIDLLRVFPECKENLTTGEIYILRDIDDEEEIGKVFLHCCILCDLFYLHLSS